MGAGAAEIETGVGYEDVGVLGAAGRAGAGGCVALPEEDVVRGTFVYVEGRGQQVLKEKEGVALGIKCLPMSEVLFDTASPSAG